MLERLEDYFLTEPQRLVQLGRALFLIGGWLIIIALGGQVATSVANGMASIGGHAGTVKLLADIYPSIPTWWVPESIVGALPAMFITGIGLWINQTGQRIRRFMGHR